MRTTLITIFSLVILTNLNAQIQKGAILTGGSFSFNGDRNTEEFSPFGSIVNDELKNSFIAIRPQIGFFTNESTLIGIGLAYERSSFEILNTSGGTTSTDFTRKENAFFINPYFAKYSKLTDQLYFTTFFDFMAGLGTEKLGENDEIENDVFELRFSVSPGLTYFVSEKWALRAQIGQLFYEWRRVEISPDNGDRVNKDNSYGLNFNLNTFTIGFQ
ncbi:MAG: hypothetical protein AAFX87_27365, partial [Bacteroidota bacterium]